MEKLLPFGKKLLLLVSFLLTGQLVSQTSLLDPVRHPKFENPLPFPAIMTPSQGENYYDVYIEQTTQDLGLYYSNGSPMGKVTKVWGYGPDGKVTYPGPTIEARTKIPITVKWKNHLPEDHLFPIDKSIHWAGTDMGGKLPEPGKEFNGIPTVTHLHGGHTNADSDGHPEAWYTPGFKYTGSNFYSNMGTYTYDNSQEAATLWYHDHVIGITRLNVYAGLAGFYLLRDDHEDGLNLPKDQPLYPGDENSPIEHFEIPLVIQDRAFTSDGQLYYPSETFVIEENNEHSAMPGEENDDVIYNSILPEMFGDFILVNGKAWPYLDVQPRKYRLRLLNGSDSRFYDLRIPGVQFFQIGSDGGLLEAPLKRNNILIGPGERIDVIVDFSAPELWGQRLIMKNNARSPYPFGDTPNPHTSGIIMAFNVVTPLNNPDTSVIPSTLRNTPTVVAARPTNKRELVLFEEMDEYGRLLPSLGTADKGALSFMDELTENPALGATEVWEIYNTTPDAHPIHLHLVHFQVINTQKFNVKKSFFGVDGKFSVQLLGNASPPAPENAGRKDTFVVFPGEVARVKALFDKEGEYVWHCHILSHEDHDMMRPFYVGDYMAPVIAALETSTISPEILETLQVAPNPIQDQAKIYFRMKANAQVLVEMYNFSGKAVSLLYSGMAVANKNYEVTFDRSGLPPGAYICKLSTPDGRSFERIVIAK